MEKYKVSVIIPVYNAQKTIDFCIQSVLNQSLHPIQLVLVNDGSADNSLDLISHYSDLDYVTIINQQNGGVSKARNAGIKNALGEYCFFLDSDDYLDCDTLEKMYDFSTQNNLDLCACSHTEYNATLYKGNDDIGMTFVAIGNDEIGKNFLSVFPKSSCAKLFKMELINKLQLRFMEDMDYAEDLYFTYTFLMKCNQIGKVSDAFYRIQNVNPVSLSKCYVNNMSVVLEKLSILWKNIVSVFPSMEESYYKECISFNFDLLISYCNNFYRYNCNLSNKEKRRQIKNFIKEHKEWLKIGDYKLKGPKNMLQFLSYISIKTRIPFIIHLLFTFKEYIKKLKFKENDVF